MSESIHPTAGGLFTPAVALVSAILGAFGLWLANRMLGKAAFQQAINTGFQALTDQLQEERATLRKVLDDERLAWAGERAQLRGEIINLTQTIESLKQLLRRNGIDVPTSSGLSKDPAPAPVVIERQDTEQ